MNSLWKQEFRQRIGIGRTRIRPQNGERRKLGKALQSARAQANILKQERSYSGQKRKSRYNLRDPPVVDALRDSWLPRTAHTHWPLGSDGSAPWLGGSRRQMKPSPAVEVETFVILVALLSFPFRISFGVNMFICP